MAEDVCRSNCVGEHVIALRQQKGIALQRCSLLNLGEGILPQGSVKELMQACGLDSAGICRAAVALMEKDGQAHE
jgi:deoxyxylulose-5-phosphate synthase